MASRAEEPGTSDLDRGLGVADRLDLLRSVLQPYPAQAGGLSRKVFDDLVDRLGMETVFTSLRRFGIPHAAVATQGENPAVADPDGLFALTHQVAQAVTEAHKGELCRLALAFREAGIPLITFKGVALNVLLGNVDAPSYGNDVDVLVPSESLAAARDKFHSLGYTTGLLIRKGRPYRLPPSVVEMREKSIYYYGQVVPLSFLFPVPALEAISSRVLQYFGQTFCSLEGRLHLRLSVDLHYSLNHLTDDLGTRSKPGEQAWLSNTQTIGIDGVDVDTLGPETLSWVLAHRLYVDVSLFQDTSLKALCHLKLLWHHGRLDSDHVRDIALRYPHLAPSLYYTLRAMDQLCGTRAQPALDPDRIRSAAAPLLNVGDCLPAMLGLDLETTLAPMSSDAASEPTATAHLV
jgi:hypothetical protein